MSKLSQFQRQDGYNPSVDVSNPIVKKYVHKQFVSSVGDTEDDFVIDEKPVLVEEYNIQKRIDEEAKGCDLKSLLKQFVMTGDPSVLNKKEGFYGDITQIQSSIEQGSPVIKPEVIKETLPDEIKGLTVEQIARMSNADIAAFVEQVKKKAQELSIKENIKEE